MSSQYQVINYLGLMTYFLPPSHFTQNSETPSLSEHEYSM